MKFGVIVFPGSNCDHDAYYVCKKVLGAEVYYVWHKETSLRFFDALILPGGFSYGDYLRAGAVARFSPVMKAIVDYAHKGGPVLGICNGFQILLEADLLPGALITNSGLRFLCQDVYLHVDNTRTVFTERYTEGQILRMPIAHYSGNYFADQNLLKRLEDEERIAFRYCDRAGKIAETTNPNGSCRNIAGILNASKNVLGMMPHPERASETALSSVDGLGIFESLLGKS